MSIAATIILCSIFFILGCIATCWLMLEQPIIQPYIIFTEVSKEQPKFEYEETSSFEYEVPDPNLKEKIHAESHKDIREWCLREHGQ